MAEKTRHEEKILREEAVERLEAIADQLRGDGDADVDVGNKTVTLSPQENIGYEITVQESSSMLGGDSEIVTIQLDWELE